MSPVCVSRCLAGFCPAAPQPDPQGDQVLCLPWRAADEDAADAGASPASIQSNHRYTKSLYGCPPPEASLGVLTMQMRGGFSGV